MGKTGSKDISAAMSYELDGDTKPSKGSTRRYVYKEMDNLNMPSIIGYAVMRCRFGLSLSFNLFLVYVLFHRFIG